MLYKVMDDIAIFIKTLIYLVFYIAVALIGLYVIWNSSLSNGVMILLLGVIAWNTSKTKEKQIV